jgi:hypothetical protein
MSDLGSLPTLHHAPALWVWLGQPKFHSSKVCFVICMHLLGFSGVFLHYILDEFETFGQKEAKVSEGYRIFDLMPTSFRQ